MRSKYCESLLSDVNKLNEKFDKFVKGKVVELMIIRRTGYYQDFYDVVAHYVSDVNFCGDGQPHDVSHWEHLAYPEFTRDFEMDINGAKLHATLRLELHGNRFMGCHYSSCVYVSDDEVKRIFPDLDENTYWPNGYNVGKYNAGGHDYYASTALTKSEDVEDMTNKGWVKDPFC